MGLQTVSKNIMLDITKTKYVVVQVKQYDKNAGQIIVKVTDNGKPFPIDTSVVPRIKCKKDDGTYVVNNCAVLEDGNIQIDITDQMTACAGTHDCELALFDSSEDKVLHTMNFVLSVKDAVFSDSEVTSSNEFIALENALLKVDEFDGKFTDIEESVRLVKEYEVSALESKNNASTSATEAKTAERNAETSASNAATYESNALTSKNNAQASELVAFKSKTNTTSYESSALTSKNKTEEYMNDSAENLELIKEHVANADKMITDVNEAIASANTMIDDLENTIDIIDTNETQRESAENQRNANENVRKQNEQLRDEAEALRKANETDRISGENERVEAENIRETNETKRQTGYAEMQETVNNMEQSLAKHNTSTSAHSDIRSLITELTNKLNTLADSDEETLDQMSEVVAYIKDNRELIESITTAKVNVSDIIDNLTTNVSNKPLSAAQGVVLKSLINALETTVNSRNTFSTVKIGSTTMSADTTSDTLELVAGDNVKITPDVNSNKIAISSTNSTYELSRNGSEIILTDSEGNTTSVSDNDIATTASTTLEGSYAGGLKINAINGKSEQDSTTGAQLFDKSNVTTGYELNSTDGSVSENSAYYVSDFIEVVENESYYLYKHTEASGISNCFYDENKNFLSTITKNYGELLVPSGAKYLRFNGSIIGIDGVMLNTGSTALPWEPYTGGQPSPNPDYPQEIRSTVISEVRSCGKNLLKNTATSQTKDGVAITINEDKSVTVNGTSASAIYINLGVTKLTKGEFRATGTPQNGGVSSYRLYFETSSSTSVYYDNGTGVVISIDNEQYVYANLEIKAGTTLNNVTFYPMIRKADIEDDTYEPYTETVAKLSNPITLYGIPTDLDGNFTDSNGQQWIADYIDVERGKVVRNVNSVDLSIAGAWQHMDVWTNPCAFRSDVLVNEKFIEGYTKKADLMCNRLKTTTPNNIAFGDFGVGQTGTIGLFVAIEGIETQEDLISYFDENETIVYYPLGTPTEEDLPTADKIALRSLATFDTVTHIITDSEVEPYIMAEYGTSKVGALAIQACNEGCINAISSVVAAGTGLVLSGTTINHKNSVTAGTAQGDADKTLEFGGTFKIPTVTYDAQGHVVGKGTTTMTMPANPNTVIIDFIIKSLPWKVWEATKSNGYYGTMFNKYGIAYPSESTVDVYWLLLQNGAIVEYHYNGARYTPTYTILSGTIPDDYILSTTPPYDTGYIYYAKGTSITKCVNIGVIKKSELVSTSIITS